MVGAVGDGVGVGGVCLCETTGLDASEQLAPDIVDAAGSGIRAGAAAVRRMAGVAGCRLVVGVEMSDRVIVIVGFVLMLVVMLGVLVVTHVRRDLVAPLGETIGYLTRTRVARIAAVLVWAWVGWHFLAR